MSTFCASVGSWVQTKWGTETGDCCHVWWPEPCPRDPCRGRKRTDCCKLSSGLQHTPWHVCTHTHKHPLPIHTVQMRRRTQGSLHPPPHMLYFRDVMLQCSRVLVMFLCLSTSDTEARVDFLITWLIYNMVLSETSAGSSEGRELSPGGERKQHMLHTVHWLLQHARREMVTLHM